MVFLTADKYTRMDEPDRPSSKRKPMYNNSVSSVVGMGTRANFSQKFKNLVWAEEYVCFVFIFNASSINTKLVAPNSVTAIIKNEL